MGRSKASKLHVPHTSRVDRSYDEVMLIWGLVMIGIGTYMAVSAAMKSEAIPFRYLVARARILWKDRAYPFLLVAGLLIAVAGIAVAFA